MANLDPVYTGEQPGSIRKLLGQLFGVEEGLDRYENVYPEGTPSYDRAGDGYSGSVNPIGRRAIRYGDAPVQGTPVEGLPWLEPPPPGRNPTDREFSPTDEEITEEEFGDVGYTGPEKMEPKIKPQYHGDGRESIRDANTRLAQENIPDDDVQDMDLTGAFPGPGPAAPSTLPPEIADASPLPPGAIGGGNMPPEALALLGGGAPANNYVDPYGGLDPNNLPMFQGNAPASMGMSPQGGPPQTQSPPPVPTDPGSKVVRGKWAGVPKRSVYSNNPYYTGDDMGDLNDIDPNSLNPLAGMDITGDASLPPGVQNQLDQMISTPVPPPSADQLALAQGGGGPSVSGAAPQITPTPLPMNPPPPPVGAANVQQAPPLPPSIPGGASGPPQGAGGETLPPVSPPAITPTPSSPVVGNVSPPSQSGFNQPLRPSAGMASGGIDTQQGGFNLMDTIMNMISSDPAAKPSGGGRGIPSIMKTLMNPPSRNDSAVATNTPRFQEASIPSPQPNAIPQILQDFQSRYGPKR